MANVLQAIQKGIDNGAHLAHGAKAMQEVSKVAVASIRLFAHITGELNPFLSGILLLAESAREFYLIVFSPMELMSLWCGEDPIWKKGTIEKREIFRVAIKTVHVAIKIMDSPVCSQIGVIAKIATSSFMTPARLVFSLANSLLKFERLWRDFKGLSHWLQETDWSSRAMRAREPGAKQELREFHQQRIGALQRELDEASAVINGGADVDTSVISQIHERMNQETLCLGMVESLIEGEHNSEIERYYQEKASEIQEARREADEARVAARNEGLRLITKIAISTLGLVALGVSLPIATACVLTGDLFSGVMGIYDIIHSVEHETI